MGGLARAFTLAGRLVLHIPKSPQVAPSGNVLQGVMTVSPTLNLAMQVKLSQGCEGFGFASAFARRRSTRGINHAPVDPAQGQHVTHSGATTMVLGPAHFIR